MIQMNRCNKGIHKVDHPVIIIQYQLFSSSYQSTVCLDQAGNPQEDATWAISLLRSCRLHQVPYHIRLSIISHDWCSCPSCWSYTYLSMGSNWSGGRGLGGIQYKINTRLSLSLKPFPCLAKDSQRSLPKHLKNFRSTSSPFPVHFQSTSSTIPVHLRSTWAP